MTRLKMDLLYQFDPFVGLNPKANRGVGGSLLRAK